MLDFITAKLLFGPLDKKMQEAAAMTLQALRDGLILTQAARY